MQSCNEDRVVCLLLGGNGRRTRKTRRFAALVQPWLHHVVDVLAAFVF
jgi:hypothetical protein